MSAYDPFAKVYDAWSASMVEDVPFYVALAREADGPIVELAVGTARVASVVARETGKRVIGIDASTEMLEQARATGADLDLRLGDMRDFALEQPAALVYCPYRSLLHLATWEDKLEVFRRVHASLRPGGLFAWNAFVFDPLIAAANEGEHPEAPVPHTIHHVPAESRIDITLHDGGARISLWWATRNEWEGLAATAGFVTAALYGDFDRTPFGEGSREFVWVLRRP